MSTRYKLLFRGQIAADQHMAVVRGRLQKMLKASDAQLELMFSGNPVSIKKNVDEAGAERYLDAFMQAGAKLEIVELDAAALAEDARKAEMLAAAAAHKKQQTEQLAAQVAAEQSQPEAGAESKAQIISTATADTIASFALADVGEDLAPATSKTTQPAASVAIDHLSVAEVGGNLVASADASSAPPLPVVDTSHLSLDEAGATLGVPTEVGAEVEALVEPDFQLGEVGELLVESSPPVEPEILDLSNFQLESLPEPADEQPA